MQQKKTRMMIIAGEAQSFLFFLMLLFISQ